MLKKALFPGKYIQGAGASNELPHLTSLFCRKGLILALSAVYNKILPEPLTVKNFTLGGIL